MVKKSILQILNGFRIVAFWIFVSLLVVSIVEAVREMQVEVTVEDAVLGDKIIEYAGIQEFGCICNGERIIVHDTEGRKTGDAVQLIFRDGKYYSLVSTMFPDNGVKLWNRVSYRFTMATGGNLIFYAVIFGVIWIVRVIVHSVSLKTNK